MSSWQQALTAPAELTTGYLASRLCERTNLPYMNKTSNYDGGEQDCFGINHVVLKGVVKQPIDIENDKYFSRHSLGTSETAIEAVCRLADSKKFVNIYFLVNPELAGFPPVTESWANSPWNKTHIQSDANPVRFAEALTSWAQQAHPILTKAFSLKEIDGPLPPLPAFDAGPAMPAASPVPEPAPILVAAASTAAGIRTGHDFVRSV